MPFCSNSAHNHGHKKKSDKLSRNGVTHESHSRSRIVVECFFVLMICVLWLETVLILVFFVLAICRLWSKIVLSLVLSLYPRFVDFGRALC